MARDFTGANTTTRLSRTVTPPSTVFSVGCWCHMDNWVTLRTFVGLGTTDAGLTGLLTGGATAQRFRLKVNRGTTDLVVEVAAAGTGAWICVVGVFTADSHFAADHIIYTGDLTTPMASQAHVVDTDSAGAISNSTSGTIGKNAGAGTAIDGRIAFPFMVPWVMTADEVERYRQGDWSPIFRGGLPTLFVPMQMNTGAAWDLANGAAWTVTSTPTVSADPPIAAGWTSPGAIVVQRKGPTVTPQSVGGGITPAGAAPKLVTKNVAGAFT